MPEHAFLYTGTPGVDGQMHDLGTLPGDLDSFGNAINDLGQVAGYSAPQGGNGEHAFLYTGTPGVDGHMVDLGTLPDGTTSVVRAMNNSGEMVGEADPAGSNVHAILYTGTPGIDGVMHDLGTLGGSNSQAFGINNTGQVVGGSDVSFGLPHAFLYTGTPGVDGHMIDLDSWLDTVNPTEGAKWTLTSAAAISDTGLIVGYGIYTLPNVGTQTAFLLDASSLIPEPCALSLLAIGGLAMLQRRQQSRDQ